MQFPTLGVLALSLVAAAAAAQPAATNRGGPPTGEPCRANPAAVTNDSNQAVAATNANAPARGANSFTEGEARRRFESHGYTNVSPLTRDEERERAYRPEGWERFDPDAPAWDRVHG
jgi:hypothetical protein